MNINRGKLVSAMAEADITNKELAERTGISPITISRIRHGSSTTFEMVAKMAIALDVSLDYLLEDELKGIKHQMFVREFKRDANKKDKRGEA